MFSKASNFKWNAESEQSFRELKSYLSSLPVLKKPARGKELFVYLAVNIRAASFVLLQKKGSTHQPIYFVSHTLKQWKLNYTMQEQLALALVITTQKLRSYFL